MTFRRTLEVVFKIVSYLFGPGVAAASLEVLKSRLGPGAGLFVATILGSAGVALAMAMEQSARSFAFLRTILDPHSRFEGVWLQTFVHPANAPVAFSLVHIEYLEARGEYNLKGHGYDSAGEEVSYFFSTDLRFDRDDEVRYEWKEDESWRGKRPEGASSMIDGVAQWKLIRTDRRVGGDGFLEHLHVSLRRFKLTKLPRRYRRKLVGRTGGDTFEQHESALAKAIAQQLLGSSVRPLSPLLASVPGGLERP